MQKDIRPGDLIFWELVVEPVAVKKGIVTETHYELKHKCQGSPTATELIVPWANRDAYLGAPGLFLVGHQWLSNEPDMQTPLLPRYLPTLEQVKLNIERTKVIAALAKAEQLDFRNGLDAVGVMSIERECLLRFNTQLELHPVDGLMIPMEIAEQLSPQSSIDFFSSYTPELPPPVDNVQLTQDSEVADLRQQIAQLTTLVQGLYDNAKNSAASSQ